jgi:hypothetical protein
LLKQVRQQPVPQKKNSPGGCACCGCRVFQDDFNRDDSTDVDGWDELSGDWSIDSQQLHEAGTDGALVIAKADVPRLSFHVAVTIPSCADGAGLRARGRTTATPVAGDDGCDPCARDPGTLWAQSRD